MAPGPDRGSSSDAHRHRQSDLNGTPQPSRSGSADGWTIKQLAHDIPLTDSAREIIDVGQRLAGANGTGPTLPIHLLQAVVLLPKNGAGRALAPLNVDTNQLRLSLGMQPGEAPPSAAPALIAPPTRYLVNNAHREAEQLGHYRVDGLHLLLALLYKDSPETADRLQAAGLSIYSVRQYLTAPQSAPRGVSRRPMPRFDKALGISPVFAIPVAAMVLGGVGLWTGIAPGLTLPLSLLFVLGGWIVSLCIHEFGHAFLAYLGGDHSVVGAGYLSLNPLKYAHPLLSVGLPIIFLLIGGIGLPGGAVYLDERSMRSNAWRAVASAGGPLGNLLFATLVGWPFIVFQGQPPAGDFHFWAALAFLVFVQITAIVLNLLPIPPFDGFGIISPWLSIELRILASRLGMLPLLLLFLVLWYGGPLAAPFWNLVFGLGNVFNIPPDLVFLGQQQSIPRLLR